MDRIEFRRISSRLEYRELNNVDEIYNTFGLTAPEPSYGKWKPMSGSKMMTLTADELRKIADLLG